MLMIPIRPKSLARTNRNAHSTHVSFTPLRLTGTPSQPSEVKWLFNDPSPRPASDVQPSAADFTNQLHLMSARLPSWRNHEASYPPEAKDSFTSDPDFVREMALWSAQQARAEPEADAASDQSTQVSSTDARRRPSGWLPQPSRAAEAQLQSDKIDRTLDAHKGKRPASFNEYWPSMHKGTRDSQALFQAQRSVKKRKDDEIPRAARHVTFGQRSHFNTIPIYDLNDDSPIEQNFDSADDECLDLSKSTYQVRAQHSLDDLINLGLDYASADRKRGRSTTGWRSWVSFCSDVMGTSPDRPMDPMTPLFRKLEDEWLAMQYCCALVQWRGISPRSAGQYFSTVQGVHSREHGVRLCGGLKLERLPQMLKGLRRVVGEKPRKVRRGVTARMLARGMEAIGLDPSNKLHANIRAALISAWSGLLRSAEYTSKNGVLDDLSIRRSDIERLNDDEAVLMIHPCKNMEHIGGRTCPLVLGSGGEYIDAVAEIKNLLTVDNVSRTLDESTPLFRDPASNKPLTYDTINSIIKQIVESQGEDPDDFATHSLRIGGATALFTAGATETVIRTMGRWSSDIYRLYVRACFEQCRAWTRRAASTTVSDLSGEFDEVDDY